MKFKIGDKVRTTKGGRMFNEGPFEGIITGFGKWKHYKAANIKKIIDGKIVQCLIKNLVNID